MSEPERPAARPYRSTSGFEIRPVYRPDADEATTDERLGEPGSFPFTRGIHPEGHRGAPRPSRPGPSPGPMPMRPPPTNDSANPAPFRSPEAFIPRAIAPARGRCASTP